MAAHSGSETRLEIVLLRSVYERQKFAMLIQMVGTAAGSTFALGLPVQYVGWWAVALIGYAVVGLVMQWLFLRSPHQARDWRLWRGIFVVQCVVSGIAWSTVPTLNIVQASTTETAILISFMLGACAIGLGILSAQRMAMWAFTACVLLPLVCMLLYRGSHGQSYIAAALVTCLGGLMALGNDMHKGLRKQLQVQFALEQALAEADLAKKQAELAQQQAQTATAAKSQFLATMSHELRTPMNGVLGMLQLVQGTELTDRQHEYLDKMNSAARSLLALLNDVLDFSRLEAGGLKLEKKRFAVNALMQSLADILAGNVRNDALKVVFEVDRNTPKELMGDERSLHQVLVNLAGNAIKFTPSGQVVVRLQVLQWTAQSVRLRFAVEDTGIGIAPEQHSAIFEAFVQTESSSTRRFAGTGLGLAICKQLVHLMGGTLQLHSSPGHGSTFWCDLDFDLPPAEALPTTIDPPVTAPAGGRVYTPPAPQRLAGLYIVLAEDNVLNQQVATELMQMEGAQVLAVDNGEQAVQALQTDAGLRTDIVLMDMHMPVMDGLSATRLLRAHPDLQHLPVLAMTANALAADRQACLDAGMNGYVGKPFTIDTLVQAIHDALGDRAPRANHSVSTIHRSI